MFEWCILCEGLTGVFDELVRDSMLGVGGECTVSTVYCMNSTFSSQPTNFLFFMNELQVILLLISEACSRVFAFFSTDMKYAAMGCWQTFLRPPLLTRAILLPFRILDLGDWFAHLFAASRLALLSLYHLPYQGYYMTILAKFL